MDYIKNLLVSRAAHQADPMSGCMPVTTTAITSIFNYENSSMNRGGRNHQQLFISCASIFFYCDSCCDALVT